MNMAETFVTFTAHEGINADGNPVRFIRARFQVGSGDWKTAFNPKGVSGVELVQRVSKTTGKSRVSTRWPVLVRYQDDHVVGSDIVSHCSIEPRPFTPQAMQSADKADLAALDGVAGAAPAPAPAPADAESESEF